MLNLKAIKFITENMNNNFDSLLTKGELAIKVHEVLNNLEVIKVYKSNNMERETSFKTVDITGVKHR